MLKVNPTILGWHLAFHWWTVWPWLGQAGTPFLSCLPV